MTSRFSVWTRQRPVAVYFILAYLITWVGVSPLVASAQGILDIQVSPNLHVIGALGPIGAAFVVTAITGGRRGVSEFLGRMFRWRVGIGWLLLTLLSPLALFLLSAAILRVSGASWPDLSQLRGAFADSAWVIGFIISSIAFGFGEEPGWRGFALPRLQKPRSALSATFILSVFWALWHLPFFFYKFEFQGAVTIVGFFLSMFAGALWLTFLYNSTGGSILMVALWHVVWNMMNLVAPVVSDDVVAVMNMLMIVVGVVALIIGGPATLSRSGKHTID